MKRYYSILCTLILLFVSTGCSKEEPMPDPDFGQMVSICELAVMDCYYHNVAKYFEPDAQGKWFWAKDKQFWVEYSGNVRMGVDSSLVNISVKNDQVSITLPPAKVLSASVDPSSLTSDAFIVAKNSAKITYEDEQLVFAEAQDYITEMASSNTTMLGNAQERVKSLLTEYVTSIGDAVGMNYQISWVLVDDNGSPIK